MGLFSLRAQHTIGVRLRRTGYRYLVRSTRCSNYLCRQKILNRGWWTPADVCVCYMPHCAVGEVAA